MSPERSTIVLVHGAWRGAWVWERVVPLLEERGLGVRAPTLPSIDADPADRSGLSGDAAAVVSVLDEVEGPKLLCGHSYGGMVVTKAAAGRTDVARLVYLCAFMPDAGESLGTITGGPAPWIRLLDDGRAMPDPALVPELLYHDCDPDDCRRGLERMRPMPLAPFEEPVDEAPWRTVPSTYVVCTRDRSIPVALQQDVLAPRAAEVVELEASHSPFFSQPGAVAALLAARA